jgi:hypothetical protein
MLRSRNLDVQLIEKLLALSTQRMPLIVSREHWIYALV